MKIKKIDPRKDPIKYMDTLPDGRRGFACSKHKMFQTDCKDCVAGWNEIWDTHDRWQQDHDNKYVNENIQAVHSTNTKEESKKKA